MDIRPARIFPLGDSAITVEFGGIMSVELNRASIALANQLTEHPFAGMIEAVPAIASTTVFYDPVAVSALDPSAATALPTAIRFIENAVELAVLPDDSAGNFIEIPASFSGSDAPDLQLVAAKVELSLDEVIDIFLSVEYRVFMLGFLPGFPYLGLVDKRIAVPRRSTPRPTVPKGSIGIAGLQTGIYPCDSPGGWQIIGRTAVDLIRPDAGRPFLVGPGDRVRFVRE